MEITFTRLFCWTAHTGTGAVGSCGCCSTLINPMSAEAGSGSTKFLSEAGVSDMGFGCMAIIAGSAWDAKKKFQLDIFMLFGWC